jgi:hypothetical protein
MAIRRLFLLTDDGQEHVCPVVEFEGEPWFVPAFLDGDPKGRPARIICLTDLAKKNSLAPKNVDLALADPLDRKVFNGEKLSRKPRVIPEPDIIITDSDFV